MTKDYQQYLFDLIEINTVSKYSNIDIVEYIEKVLSPLGYAFQRIPSPDGEKASLVAIAGDPARAGVVLSGHTDVVPVEGQPWTTDPFSAVVRDRRVYGRGATDMKGFLAVVLAQAANLASSATETPVILAFSHDEELGCKGAPPLVEHIAALPALPGLCIVGEPTGLKVANAHKGKLAKRITFRGKTGHSAMPHKAASALWSGAKLALEIKARADSLARKGGDSSFDPPFSTLHVGSLISGGALNLVPDQASLEFELRSLPGVDTEAVIATILAQAEAEGEALKARAPECGVVIEEISRYPGLLTDGDGPHAQAVRKLAQDSGSPLSLSFGTEAGLFSEAGIPTLVCGPGNMDRAHKADEWIAIEELAAASTMLERLASRLSTPLSEWIPQ
ncbi:acetylornithine deacetylase [Roseibium marinum]|uniref:Acetylornithine deacetylase n=1 Tax=Roseibium marinum TaxID=281252 RepID=A0A2S3UT99_9HYPH|nr:acetylornithine deacetylase [Roseibium marinum]POF30941.1 acetylornithine deacetylase [Roseibium marinum]